MTLSCKKVEESLPGFATSELDDSEVADVEEHLESCESCRQELEEIRQALGLLCEWETPGQPEGLALRTLQKIEVERQGPKTWEERYHNFVSWLSNLEITPIRGLLATACGFCLFFLLMHLAPPASREASPATNLVDCRRNLEMLVQASRNYQRDRGELPNCIEDLQGEHLRSFPICPSAGYNTYSESFLLRTSGEPLVLYCHGHYHAQTDLGPNEPRLEVP